MGAFCLIILIGHNHRCLYPNKQTKNKQTEITFKEDRFANRNSFDNLQLLVATSQFGIKPEVKVEESPMKFGGGGFSGGGSGGEF